jgi:hypothetical protein
MILSLPMSLSAQTPAVTEKKPAQKTRPPLEVFTDAEKAGADFQIQGEYRSQSSTLAEKAAQVIAEGEGKFTIRLLVGGLPGEGWDEITEVRIKAQTKDGVVSFENDNYTGSIANARLSLRKNGTTTILDRVVRQSPTNGLKPEQRAVALFDGKSVELWNRGRLIENDLLRCGATTKHSFGDFKMHIEFRTPFVPKARGQSRGNSGVYIHGKYEVQILDSFGLAGKNNECGAIYQVVTPRVNMCYPPLSWQTFDIDFVGPRFAEGEKKADAIITVRHNGVVIQDRVKIPRPTGENYRVENGEPGPINLQDHGTPVAFRNIWLVETK